MTRNSPFHGVSESSSNLKHEENPKNSEEGKTQFLQNCCQPLYELNLKASKWVCSAGVTSPSDGLMQPSSSFKEVSGSSIGKLREAGFGYRAKYMVGRLKALQSKPGGGAEWLASLRELDLHEAIDAVSTLPGVGPKVAACIAIFSLHHRHAIPIDEYEAFIHTTRVAHADLTASTTGEIDEAHVIVVGDCILILTFWRDVLFSCLYGYLC
ncbi:hypothetical protein NE237_020374 [Protea cynaroides]|uniref:HhH-GPD domain-containing protein n=1 Tax=Protea cynaroides TaxID=273540 RepID=A0A9Q0H747_9MAGN|nr:hypothetical protein NE237_020374 [Protea cynaroides]